MNIDDCYLLGYVVKAHGTKGGVVIYLDTDNPQEYYQMESVFVQTNEDLIPFFIEGFDQTNQPDKLITYFEGIETIEEANKLKGQKLYLPLTDLPKLNEDQFYYHDVVGFTIKDVNKGNIGSLKTIYEISSGDMMAVDIDNVEVLIPLKEPLFQSIDKKKKIIYTHLPDGYLEVFLSDPNQPNDEV